jgi:hypothetical protein
MKLKHFQYLENYCFMLTFANGEIRTVDLTLLISHYVAPEALQTATINAEWGCLEFNQGNVDIEPKTLYRFAQTQPILDSQNILLV